MHGMVPPDPETDILQVRYAVVYTLKQKRPRFSAGCVTLMDDAEQAMQNANTDQHCYAAQVVGPSRSSEGQYIFYLLNWL